MPTDFHTVQEICQMCFPDTAHVTRFV